MQRSLPVRTVRRLLTATALLPAWLLQACFTWRTQPIAPRQAIEQRPLVRARLVGVDHRTIVLTGPRIRGDSVAGLIGMEERVVALRDVSAVQIQRFSAGRTIGLVALGALAFSVAMELWGPRPESTCPGLQIWC
jgi:hypothetical protein